MARRSMRCATFIFVLFSALAGTATVSVARQCIIIPESTPPTVGSDIDTLSSNAADTGTAASTSELESAKGCQRINATWSDRSAPQNLLVNSRSYTMLVCDGSSSNGVAKSGRANARQPVEPTIGGDIAGVSEAATDTTNYSERPRNESGSTGNRDRQPIEPTIGADVQFLECKYNKKCKGYELSRGSEPVGVVKISTGDGAMSFDDGCIR